MSKLGKKPIEIPASVEVKLSGSPSTGSGCIEFKGVKGVLLLAVLPFLNVQLEDKKLLFSPQKDSKQAAANWGTMVSLAKNAITGVADGFNKALQIEGVGFRAQIEGKDLILNLGFSHPVKFTPPESIALEVEKNIIKVSGINKETVGEVAAKIRKLKKPEPYKGKGIRYVGEVVRRKAGKRAAGATG